MNLENTRPSGKKHRPPDARDMKNRVPKVHEKLIKVQLHVEQTLAM